MHCRRNGFVNKLCRHEIVEFEWLVYSEIGTVLELISLDEWGGEVFVSSGGNGNEAIGRKDAVFLVEE